jgi:hypothetical protein
VRGRVRVYLVRLVVPLSRRHVNEMNFSSGIMKRPKRTQRDLTCKVVGMHTSQNISNTRTRIILARSPVLCRK